MGEKKFFEEVDKQKKEIQVGLIKISNEITSLADVIKSYIEIKDKGGLKKDDVKTGIELIDAKSKKIEEDFEKMKAIFSIIIEKLEGRLKK